MDCFTALTLQPKLHHNARKENEKSQARRIVGYLLEVSGILHRQKVLQQSGSTCARIFLSKCSSNNTCFQCNMSVQKLKKSPKDVGVSNGSVSATVKKAFKKNSDWEDKVRALNLRDTSFQVDEKY